MYDHSVTPGRGGRIFAGIALMLLSVYAALLGHYHFSAGPMQESPHLTDRPWHSFSMGDLSLQIPELPRRVAISDSGGLKAIAESFETYEGKAGNVIVTVSWARYRPSVEICLRRGAAGAFAQAAAEMGVPPPSAEFAEVEVSGLPAIRGSTHFAVEGESIAAESITIARGQEAWQVITMFPSDSSAREVSNRLLRSVAVALKE